MPYSNEVQAVDQCRRRTKCIDCDSCCKVKVLLSVGIIQTCTFAAGEHYLWPGICLHDVPAERQNIGQLC